MSLATVQPSAEQPAGAPHAPSPWRHVPNALTGLRIVLVVPLVWLICTRRFDAALLVAACAGATDALDGYLAKRFGWQSWLGGMLDPIADKVLLIACFVTLGMIHAHPVWLTWLVVGRDVVIVAGASIYHAWVGRVSAAPMPLSKLTTCVQIAYVLVQLMQLTTWFALPVWLLSALIWLTASLTLLSGLQYVLVWSLKARHEIRARVKAAP